ncbi:MAG: hypothetical protein JRF59_00985 [Deltaproteobacteria bacterium]|nr:hypothetical protein [Deltaproteobacteria bacterium]MBW1948241.1 hypothetical protein [Deltaproteobacteria bacterium]MBW2101449.1 hypothetical protein [Deltaproteobacteria bacterium]MBW2346402.1 hypothetical protein [Deltaproteobacteria bacterium]RLB38008.1 MAG: hypothetical protein DRH20_06625 [Deltaproteobacteria bacterium]
MIDSFGFGWMVIKGRKYASDLLIHAEGRVEDGWRRACGHELTVDDLSSLIQDLPEVIVAGTGMNGRVVPREDLEERLARRGIAFHAHPNPGAVSLYLELLPSTRVCACFHLTC